MPIKSYENSELYQYVYPMFHYAYGRVREAELPLWNPRQLCGAPLYTDPRVGLFQPLNAPFLFLSTERAMAVHPFLCLFFMGLGCALLALSFGSGYAPAFLAGIVYAFCGASASAMSQPSLADALAWAPFCFLGLRVYLMTWKWRYACLSGVTGGLFILSGAASIIAAMLLLLIPMALLGLLLPEQGERPPSFSRAVAGLAAAALFSLGLSAVQWLPAIWWIAGLEQPWDFLWRLDLDTQAPSGLRAMALQLIMCQSGALPRMGYVGIITLFFLLAACFHWPQRRNVVILFVCLAGCAGLYLSGASILPSVYPREAMLFPMSLCAALLAAIGADRLTVRPQDPRVPTAWLPGLAMLFLAGLLFWISADQARGYIIVFLCILFPMLLVRHRWFLTFCAAALAIFLFFDLTIANVNAYRHPFSDAPGCYQRYSSAIQEAVDLSAGGRVLLSPGPLDTGMPGNLGMLSPLMAVGGAHLPLTQEQAVWWERLGQSSAASFQATASNVLPEAEMPNLLNYMAARVIMATSEGPLYTGEWRGQGPRLHLTHAPGNIRIFLNESAMPRAYWVPAWRAGYTSAAAADLLGDVNFNRDYECLLDSAPNSFSNASTAGPLPSRNQAACAIEEISPEKIILRVDAPTAGVAVLLDSYAPGWRATLDGQPAEILRANGLFRGVACPEGTHEIVMAYRPRVLYAGAGVAALAILALALSFPLHRWMP